jgi:hypothetical protein
MLISGYDVVKLAGVLAQPSQDILQTYANLHLFTATSVYNRTDDTKAFAEALKFMSQWFLETEQFAGRDGSNALEKVRG